MFTNILVGIFGLYLSAVSGLAGFLDTYVPHLTVQPAYVDSQTLTSVPPNELTPLPSRYSLSNSLPKILIENASYQGAAARGATDITSTTQDDRPVTEQISEALVNIFCQYETESYRRTTTGSGFFISHRGVILTNAHVAQYLLLEDTAGVTEAQCVIRTGSPAVASYKAELLYLPPTWVNEHAHLLNAEQAIGTGERDYALLYVARSLDTTPVPAYFPALNIDTNLLPRSTEGEVVLAAGYPAELLMREGVDAELTPTIASTTVTTLYTFGTNYADIFSVTDSPVGEYGASGGAVTRSDGTAIGLISTKGNPTTEGEKSLRALTLSYVDRTIQEETGFTLAETMSGDLARRSAIYRDALVPFLSQILSYNLERN